MSNDSRKKAREHLYDLVSEESFIIHACNDPKLLATHSSVVDHCMSGERADLATRLYDLASASEPLTEESLRLKGAPEEVRGLFAKLAAQPIPEVSVTSVVDHLRDVAARREVATGASSAFSSAVEGNHKAIDQIETLEASASKARLLLQGHMTAGGIFSAASGIPALIEDIQWRAQNPGKIKGHDFGFFQIEKLLDGLQPSKLYLIGARPSVGKTAFAGNIVVNLLRKGLGGVFFSAEMSRLQLQQRLIATMTGVNPSKSVHGVLNKQDLISLKQGITEMKSWPLWIDDTDRINIELLRSRARQAVSREGAKWVIVDYIGLIRGVEPKSKMSKKEEVGEVSAALKALSKELEIPVIALAQLRRTGNAYNSNSGTTEIPKPNLESLKESGDLEQDADAVILLHRDINKNVHDASAIIAKNRSGGLGEIALNFSSDTTSFKESNSPFSTT